MTAADEIRMCQPGGGRGFIAPVFGDAENRWPGGIRVILYLLGLGYCFMGVAVVSDIFMSAIECITSKKKRKYDPETKRYSTVDVWNPTVANLTLMALGSSAPEILLSIIELLGNNLYSGDLGPSTIVGSAAFNLFCIIAVCIVSIPDGEVRSIKEMPVYFVTAICSIFAYLWLLVILLANSKNIVEPWEGVMTFLFFPGLVAAAYAADVGYKRTEAKEEEIVLSADMSKEELASVDARIRREYGKDLTAEQVSKIAQIEYGNHHSRAQYRVAATRAMTGGRRVHLLSESIKDLARNFGGPVAAKSRGPYEDLHKVMPLNEGDKPPDPSAKPTILEFGTSKYAVLENAGCVKTVVKRFGNEQFAATVCYKTCDGTAHAESDYVPVEGQLIFSPGEVEKIIEVRIIDDIAYEEDEEFYIDLFCPTVADPRGNPMLGPRPRATIVIIDDDLPGVISWPQDHITVQEQVEDYMVDLVVDRKNGCTGKVTCKYRTESGSAISGLDFEELDGVLTFEDNETQARIQVCIKARGRYERTEDFRVILTVPTGGAKFDPETDGGAESCILTVFIESEQAGKDRVDKLMTSLNVNWDRAKVGHSNWCEQIKEAIYVNGEADEEEGEGGKAEGDGEQAEASGEPSIQDWITHLVFLPWKVIFALLVPPTDYCGGWLCFCFSLLMIGCVTAIISDLASLLGCVMDVPDYVTAITFVALGTSLPDTFASKTAAMQDPFADASVGNVTGSNSVNVFLGLGLPWMLGAIYWRSGGADDEWRAKYANHPDIDSHFKDGAFVVMAGTLAFSVTVFSICACVCLVVLYCRRRIFKGELGGPKVGKWATAVLLVSLWVTYVILSSSRAMTDT